MLVSAGALAVWTAAGGTPWALVALAAALGTLVLAGRERRPALVALALVAAVGAMGAWRAARRIRAVETRWPVEREALIEDAGRRLNATLDQAVDLARSLAARAARVGAVSQAERFQRLDAEIRPGPLEQGVAVFDSAGQPVAWAGRHRVPVRLPSDELDAFITPFYAVLTAQRQDAGRVAASQVLLAADIAVPDRDHSVAAQFAARTGVDLEFFPPRTAPAAWTDVFDYCLPRCRDTSVVPDTLFSVRAVPPTQGDRKLELVAGGRRWSTVAATLSLVLLAFAGGMVARYAAAAAIAALYLFTPAGESVGLGAAFSPATYYLGPLGPFGASAGALLLTAALVIIAAAAWWRLGARPGRGARGVAVLLVAGTPFALTVLARGITPPGTGVSLGLWLSWEGTITAAGAALVLLAAALLRDAVRSPRARWAAWAAGGWAVACAVVGLAVWSPAGGWPPWFPFLWLPALALAVRPAGMARGVLVSAAVTGSLAALLTWGATARGRLALAERDVARVEAGDDPFIAGLLERFGATLADGPAPLSAASLYREWRASSLARDDYLPVLAAWDLAGRPVARLDLSELDLPPALLQALARSAADDGFPVVESLKRTLGVYYVLAVPFRREGVVTVGVGPRSQLFPPVRVARFLRGERAERAPYEVTLSEGLFRTSPAPPEWVREGWVVRAERPLAVPGAARRVHLRVDLGDPGQLVVRGALVILLDAVCLGVIWLAGCALTGALGLPAPVLPQVPPRSYRIRLTLVLSVFFVAPTVGFAAWSLTRVQVDAETDAELLTRQTLRDASTAIRDFSPDFRNTWPTGLQDLSSRFGADLMVYQGGMLEASSTPVLQELGLVDPYLPPAVYRRLLIEDDVNVSQVVSIGGRDTRVGYRNIGAWRGQPTVLGSPRLLDDAELLAEREDLVLTLTLATLGGLAAAAWLSALAARALARPVHALRVAAEAVGQGQALPPRDPTVPAEFVPVVEGMERMSQDVQASQAALEAARQRTAGVLRSVATGVVALDRDRKVTMANPRAEELLGVSLREGSDVRQLTGERWQSLWEWVDAFASGAAEPQAHELVVEDRRIRAQVAPLGADGGCVVALDDATDLARAVRVLAWGELARQIAHEIKNPLTPLRLGIQHLERTYRDRREGYGETLEKTSRQILAEIERLDSIARAFARFGAPPAEAGPLARENLAEAARETAQLYALGGDASVQVEGEPVVEGRVRRDEFKEVLVNLVENARTAGASRIRIGLSAADGEARIAVQDDGSGILPEHLPRIFEPQFSTTTSGAGLGLAICKRLVESWGGAIQVASEPGRGTTVTIVTPG
jgi:signal transduction histidine kinase